MFWNAQVAVCGGGVGIIIHTKCLVVLLHPPQWAVEAWLVPGEDGRVLREARKWRRLSLGCRELY